LVLEYTIRRARRGNRARIRRLRAGAEPWRRERCETGAPYIDRLLVGVRIRISDAPQVNERIATAGADARARAQAEEAAAMAVLADQRHGALAEQARLAEASYEAGNLPFAEGARVRAQIAQVDAQRRRARVAGGRAALQINQTLGLEPQ